jgi:ABC transporter substrate binding protein
VRVELHDCREGVRNGLLFLCLARSNAARMSSRRVRAQQSIQTRRIGVLMGFAESDPEAQSNIAAFRQRLQKLGWTGGNVRISYRWVAGDAARMRAFASELVALQPDAVLAVTTPALAALQRETRTVPIVFVQVSDPVRDGFVGSLTSPSGNVTGFSSILPSLPPWRRQPKPIYQSLAAIKTPIDWPAPGSDIEDWIFAAAVVIFVEPLQSERPQMLLRNVLGGKRYEYLLALLTFIRAAHYWTVVHPGLEIEDDVVEFMRTHRELATLLLQDPDVGPSNQQSQNIPIMGA